MIALFFTILIFGFFLYYYVWRNRHITQIRLAITRIDGRVIGIERVVETKKIQVDHHLEIDTLALKSVEWKVIYKDRDDSVRKTRCHIADGHLHFDPPLS